MIYGRAFGSCLLIGITHCLTFYIIEPRTLAFIQFIVQFSKVIVSSPHRDDLYILPDVFHLVNTFSKKTQNNSHSSAHTGVGSKISVVSPSIQEIPYNVILQYNQASRTTSPTTTETLSQSSRKQPHQVLLPQWGCFRTPQCLFKKNQKSLKKVLTTIGLVNII